MRLWRGLVWALDLVDPKGEPDFGKFMQAGTQIVLLVLLWRSKEIPLALALLLVLGAHGTRTLLAAIKLGVFKVGATVTENRTLTRTETVQRRDAELGIEPTP